MTKEDLVKKSKALNLEHPYFRYGQSVWTYCSSVDSELAHQVEDASDWKIFYIVDGDVDMPELVDRFINTFLTKLNDKD